MERRIVSSSALAYFFSWAFFHSSYEGDAEGADKDVEQLPLEAIERSIRAMVRAAIFANNSDRS
jgi:hypothetical protein